PDCGGVCRHDAVLCTNCGLDLETGKKQRRKKFDPVERFWEARWPLNTRLLIFAGMQALNFCICAVIGLLSGSLNFAIVAFILQTALQAFLIGSYESLTVRRNAKGHTTIDRVWRLGFIPLPVTPIDWKESHGLGLVGSHDSGALEVGTAVYLFLCAGGIPAIVFWVLVAHPQKFTVNLCDVYGSTDARIFTTTNRDTAVEVAKLIADCTGLRYKPVQ
ncbi:MAG: hypothetical protein ACRCZF_03295, partial [Gemmataceae bacterium]